MQINGDGDVVQTTVKDFAKKHDLDYNQANQLLQMLTSKGVAKEVGKRKTSPTGKGRAATIFEVPTTLKFDLAAA